jgi:hypothetical protein
VFGSRAARRALLRHLQCRVRDGFVLEDRRIPRGYNPDVPVGSSREESWDADVKPWWIDARQRFPRTCVYGRARKSRVPCHFAGVIGVEGARGRGRRMAAGKCGYSAEATGTDAARLSSNPAPWPSLWTPPCPLISPTFSVRPSHWLLRASSFADLSSPRTCKVVAPRVRVRQWRGRLDRRLDRRLGGACASLQKACQKRHGCICYGNVKVGNTEIRGQDHVQVTKRVFAKAGLCCTCRRSRPNKRLLLVPKRLGFAVA